MSNKFLEECLIEFRHLLKEWRNEIAARHEQQLVSLSSPNILGDNNSIDPHDSIATSENPSTIQTSIKPPRTTSSPRPCQPEILIASSHKPVNFTTSPPTVNQSHKSPTETQTPKTTTIFQNPTQNPKKQNRSTKTHQTNPDPYQNPNPTSHPPPCAGEQAVAQQTDAAAAAREERRETSYEKATTEALETLTSLPTSQMHPQATPLQILKCPRISCHPVRLRNRLSVFHVSCFVVQKKEEKEVTLVWW
jgi:hypothetical protein